MESPVDIPVCGSPSQFSKLDITAIALQMKQDLEIKDRVYHFKTYKDCFLGSEAIAWLRLQLGNVEV
jgi:hypothetical protein